MRIWGQLLPCALSSEETYLKSSCSRVSPGGVNRAAHTASMMTMIYGMTFVNTDAKIHTSRPNEARNLGKSHSLLSAPAGIFKLAEFNSDLTNYQRGRLTAVELQALKWGRVYARRVGRGGPLPDGSIGNKRQDFRNRKFKCKAANVPYLDTPQG